MRAVVSTGSDFVKFGLMYSATLANVNYSLITNLYGLTPFVTAIAFYFIFKEKLNKYHLIGMSFIFICLIILALS